MHYVWFDLGDHNVQIGRVQGFATATVKHPSLNTWRMLVVQPCDTAGKPDGEPLLVLDSLGAGSGDTVIMTSDGKGARELVNAENSPARWFVMGITDGSLT